ncbi:response regulator transcription factor [Tunicatimonas pelagia]|uniref:response regulator transcription factor n=1 Tax=Tunicatimonas pelagia TaxID=931531 RepID=UPI00266529C4|nr:response regulator transcription factor [Tunicatimonas pelagia]WKN40651.1 response regulator transcription factor [Tunicatimonas pelagia]
MKVLLAEDDQNLGMILNDYLTAKGYETILCRDGEEALATFKKEDSLSICILDVMMPKMDGFELAEEIRQLDSKIPMIFLTAKSMKEDTIAGLKLGADDYITKPFSMEELLLRIQAILRRTQPEDAEQSQYAFGKFAYDYQKRILQHDEHEVKLTSKESELLKLFAQNVNQTVDRTKALKVVWGDDSYFNARSMDVYIAKLRKYLKPDEDVQILTVHGQGFKLVDLS